MSTIIDKELLYWWVFQRIDSPWFTKGLQTKLPLQCWCMGKTGILHILGYCLLFYCALQACMFL